MSDTSSPDLDPDDHRGLFKLAPAGVEFPKINPIPNTPVTRIPDITSSHPETGKTVTKPGKITP